MPVQIVSKIGGKNLEQQREKQKSMWRIIII
jgi:hypothetical protein